MVFPSNFQNLCRNSRSIPSIPGVFPELTLSSAALSSSSVIFLFVFSFSSSVSILLVTSGLSFRSPRNFSMETPSGLSLFLNMSSKKLCTSSRSSCVSVYFFLFFSSLFDGYSICFLSLARFINHFVGFSIFICLNMVVFSASFLK